MLDTRSIRAANHVAAVTTGKDAGKKVPGRKRGQVKLAAELKRLVNRHILTERQPGLFTLTEKQA